MPETASSRRSTAVALICVAAGLLLAGEGSRADVLSRSAVPANQSSLVAGLSPNGRYVLLISWASNLVRGDANNGSDAFVRDRVKGTTELVSVGVGGTPAGARDASMSADGRYVAFESSGTVFLRDRLAKSTTALTRAGTVGAVGGDGRFITFSSEESNLVPGDTNGVTDTFVHDRVAGTTERVSVASNGTQGNGDSGSGRISADGRFVAFGSNASDLVAGDTNGARDVFIRDRLAHTTARVSIGGLPAGAVISLSSLSADGRYAAVQVQVEASSKLYVVSRADGRTEQVGVGTQWSEGGVLSADGRYVVFDTTLYASGKRVGPLAGHVFLRDRVRNTTEKITVTPSGRDANGISFAGAVSADGRYVAFQSDASNLVPGDTYVCGDEGDHFNCTDVFVRDRVAKRTTLVSVGLPQAPALLRLRLRPWPARAGHLLTATTDVAYNITLVRARITCRATVAGTELRVSGQSYFDHVARCAWTVPAGARGKQMRGSLTVTAPTGTSVRRFAGVVR